VEKHPQHPLLGGTRCRRRRSKSNYLPKSQHTWKRYGLLLLLLTNAANWLPNNTSFLPVDSSWRSIAKHGVRRRIGVPLDEERDSIGDHASFAHVMRALCLLLLLLAGPGLQRERQRLHTDTRMFMCDLPLPAYGPALPFWD